MKIKTPNQSVEQMIKIAKVIKENLPSNIEFYINNKRYGYEVVTKNKKHQTLLDSAFMVEYDNNDFNQLLPNYIPEFI